MSTAVYAEPYRLPAGVLAVVVHSIFFALLYFGFSWNRPIASPAAMSVELWASLPEQVVVPPVELKVEEVMPPPVQEKIAQPLEPQIAEPEIIMPEKKIVTPKPVIIKPEKKKPVIPQIVEKVQPKPEVPKPVEPDLEARRIANEQAAREQAAHEQAAQEAAQQVAQQAARIQAEQNRLGELAASKDRMVDEYKAKIMAKIRSKIVEPPDVAQDARAEFLVTLLPGGAVLKAELKKSSGNGAYDNAVERAIFKSDPLPLPPDVQLFSRFRELDLTFKPEKTN